jgi:hypothetical protein
MKRKTEMHIMLLLLNIIILSSLIITSANGCGLWSECRYGDGIYSPQGCGCGDHYGSGIYNGAGTVNMNDCSIVGNSADHPNRHDKSDERGCGCNDHRGAGIYNSAGTVNMNGGSIVGNTATQGSGIYNYGMGTVNMNGGSIAENNAKMDIPDSAVNSERLIRFTPFSRANR